MKHHGSMRLLSGIPRWDIAKPFKMAVRNRVYFALYFKDVGWDLTGRIHASM